MTPQGGPRGREARVWAVIAASNARPRPAGCAPLRATARPHRLIFREGRGRSGPAAARRGAVRLTRATSLKVCSSSGASRAKRRAAWRHPASQRGSRGMEQGRGAVPALCSDSDLAKYYSASRVGRGAGHSLGRGRLRHALAGERSQSTHTVAVAGPALRWCPEGPGWPAPAVPKAEEALGLRPTRQPDRS